MPRQLQVPVTACFTVKLDQAEFNARMAGNKLRIRTVRPKVSAQAVCKPDGDPEQFVLSCRVSVSDAGFEDVSEADQFMRFQKIMERFIRMFNLEIGKDIAVLLLRSRNQVDCPVRPRLNLRIPVMRQRIGRRFQPFAKAFILKNISYMFSLNLSGGNPEIMDDAAFSVIIDHAPLIRDDCAFHHIRVAGKKQILDLNASDINCPDVMNGSHRCCTSVWNCPFRVVLLLS